MQVISLLSKFLFSTNFCSPQVRGTMSSNQAVAIKIAKGSLEHQQFSQVYPVFIFPSVFCIGLTGKALAIMNGKQTADELKEKLTEAFQKLNEELEPVASPQTAPTQSETPPTQSEAPPTQPEGSGASQPPPPIPPRPSQELSQSPPPLPPRPSSVEGKDSATGGAEAEEGEKLVPPSGGHEGAEGRGQSAAAAWQGSREEKLERAQQTIRQRRREKEEAEIEKEKMAELKRREEGRGLGASRRNPSKTSADRAGSARERKPRRRRKRQERLFEPN
ncbi:UBX domain-containing protein 4 [Geodia barretti]|uniref:UBX domain-containing protein 4 n=1 Tax=Geodia barretti TaxID=519541 RepID=A0AA35QR75_GEOBA|nr:UBX domain-containing protein 4 [Geodia barretti]